MPRSEGLLTHEMSGITITYPSNARIDQGGPDRLRIVGPAFDFHSADGSQLVDLPGYELDIEIHENVQGLSADEWARKQILDAWHQAKAADQPVGALPVTTSGEIDEDKVQEAWVAGLPAIRIEFFALDGCFWQYYVTLCDQIVEIQHTVNIERNVPYARMQEDIYSLILAAMRLESRGEALGGEAAAASNQSSSDLATACDQQMGFCTCYPASWIFRTWDYSDSESEVSVTSAEMESGVAMGDGMWISVLAVDAEAGVPFETWIKGFAEPPLGLGHHLRVRRLYRARSPSSHRRPSLASTLVLSQPSYRVIIRGALSHAILAQRVGA